MNDGSATLTSLVHSLGLGQLNCRCLWWRDGSVHDGFMGLVSLQVLCVQETQSSLMSSLPVDQPFRCDGLVGSCGREAGFLLHSSIVSPIPGTPDSQSLRWRLISGSLCVCSFYAPHVGNASDTRIQFWRTLAASVHRVSQLHTGIPLLLARNSNIWFPFFQLGRSRQADAPLLPIVQEILQSHSLVFRNPLIFLLTVVVPLWTSFSQHFLSQAASLSTLVPIAVHSRLCVAPCFLPTTCCALVVLSFPRLLCLPTQPTLLPCPVCVTGQLWSPLAITVFLLGTSPSWPTFLAHSLTLLRALPLWTLSSTPSLKSSSTVHLFTLVVALGPARAQATSLVE